MPIYMQIDGIQGDATQQDHKDWMNIEAIHWNVSRTVKTSVGAAKNREASEPSISEVVVTKVSDSSAAALFQASCTGSGGKTVKIHLTTTGDPGKTYIEYTLEQALIANYTVNSSGDRPIETIRLNFTKIEVKYKKLDQNNQEVGQDVSVYDAALGMKTA